MRKVIITHATAGILLFVGSFQWITISLIANSISHGFLSGTDIHIQISSLELSFTVIPAFIFMQSVSTILFGLLIMISAIILHFTYRYTLFTLLFSMSGLCLTILGFISSVTVMHVDYLKPAWFMMLSLSAVTGYLLVKKPVSFCSLFIGIYCLIMLFVTNIMNSGSSPYIPGSGGLEQIIEYPLVLWICTLAGYFMGYPETFTLKRRR